MKPVLDVIVTISADTPAGYPKQALASVQSAMDAACYPVNLICVGGVPGHIGEAMYQGLQYSSAEYVTWVDDDDFVLPQAFACLAPHYPGKPPAICARETHLLNNGRMVAFHQRHHLTAWRRDVLEQMPLRDHPAYPLVPLFRAVKDTAVDELSWVYVRRIRQSGGMKLRGQHGFGR